MPLASNLTPEQRFLSMFIGAKHSGKTCAACSFIVEDIMKKEPKLIKVFDFDGRIRGILGASWLDKYRQYIDYTYFPPKTSTKDSTFFERVNKECETLLIQASQPSGSPYGTVIADSLTAETFGLLSDSIPLTHNKRTEQGKEYQAGKRIGNLAMPGPEDYGFEATGTYQFIAFLRSLPIQNIIVTAHIVDKYGRLPGPDGKIDPYSESTVVGEKLSLRDKISTNIGVYFDHIFRFERRFDGQGEHFYVRFKSDLACTSYPNLPDNEVEITGKDFRNVLMDLIRKNQPTELPTK